jgi:alpha-mannosidase
MNNHWGTNYRAYQEGPVVFRYILRPHGPLDPAATNRLAVEKSQPLIPVRARGEAPESRPVVTISDPNILATAMKPSDDGRAIILRLWCASDENRMAELMWEKFTPSAVYISNTSEKALQPAPNEIEVPAWGVVTLRAELP